MVNKQKSLWHDVGAALPVLTLYLLTLIAPLHQAQAAQNTFAQLGYANLSSFSLCSYGTTDETGAKVPNLCPIAGIDKSFNTTPASPTQALRVALFGVFVEYPAEQAHVVAAHASHYKSPRAPPASQ